LARRATALRELDQPREALLVLDAGDLLFLDAELYPQTAQVQIRRAQRMVEGYNRLGVDALNVGERDLAAGLPFLQALADSARFAILSANLLDDRSQTTPFPAYTILERGGLNIALIGISSPIGTGRGFSFLPLLPTLEQAVHRVRESADLIILLFHGTRDDLDRIQAAQLPLDLILPSHDTIHQSYGLEGVPTTPLGSLGKVLNLIRLQVETPGERLVDLDQAQRTLDLVDKQLSRLARNKPEDLSLDEYYREQPDRLKRLRELEAAGSRTRKLLVEARNTLKHERITLDKSIRDDQDYSDLVAGIGTAPEGMSNTGAESPGR
jgi:2',3'-cyclic-nucleotide 2'-phosphodiesterase (5'-nucleotidase family)